ncbi:MAG: hypothetical protein PHV68_08435 [Candidatus Gastranaerophilales bacterium]|nr:hypothetical protein [Candidatus Gastranaerophilales bacterium]
MSDYLFYDLSGGINTIDSKTALGINPKPFYWADSQNIDIYKKGGIARMNGNSLFASVPSSVISMGQYFSGEQNILVLNTDNGSFYCYDPSLGIFVLKKSGLTSSAKATYVSYNNGVVVSNGIDDPFFFEKGAENEVVQCNASRYGVNIRGTAMAVYKGRLFVSSGSSLYYSALGRYDDWETAQDSGFISNFHNDSSSITCLKNYKGYLAVYKKNSVYLLSGSDYTDFAITPFADKGSMSQNGAITVENRQYLFDGGLFSLEQAGELNQIYLSSEYSKLIHNQFETVDLTRSSEALILPLASKNQIWLFLPFKSNNYLNCIWIYDYINKAWFKRVLPQNITTACVFGENICSADSSGNIYLENSSTTFNGSPIEFYWESPFLSFNEPNKLKTIDEFYFTLDSIYDNNFLFQLKRNYVSNEIDEIDTVTLVDSDTLLWNQNDWPGDSDTLNWAISIDSDFKSAIAGSNKSVQIRIYGNQAVQSIALLGFEFRDVLLDE